MSGCSHCMGRTLCGKDFLQNQLSRSRDSIFTNIQLTYNLHVFSLLMYSICFFQFFPLYGICFKSGLVLLARTGASDDDFEKGNQILISVLLSGELKHLGG